MNLPLVNGVIIKCLSLIHWRQHSAIFVPSFLLLLSDLSPVFIFLLMLMSLLFSGVCSLTDVLDQTHLDVTSPVTSGTILKVGGVRTTFIFVSLTVNLMISLQVALGKKEKKHRRQQENSPVKPQKTSHRHLCCCSRFSDKQFIFIITKLNVVIYIVHDSREN